MAEELVTVQVLSGRLRVDAPTGLYRMSLLRELDVPVAHIVKVEVVDSPVSAVRGWRVGIGLPDLRMGTWRHNGTKDYVAVRTTERGVVVTLRNHSFSRLILSVTDAEGLKSRIEAARRA